MSRRYTVEVEVPSFKGYDDVPFTIVHGHMDTREVQRIVAENGWLVENYSNHEYRDTCQYILQTFTRRQVAVIRKHFEDKGVLFVVPALSIGIGTPCHTDWVPGNCGLEPLTHWGGRECPFRILGHFDLRTDEEKRAAHMEHMETEGVPF